jgi:hypothetical protein
MRRLRREEGPDRLGVVTTNSMRRDQPMDDDRQPGMIEAVAADIANDTLQHLGVPPSQEPTAYWTGLFWLGLFLIRGGFVALAGGFDGRVFAIAPMLPIKWLVILVGLTAGAER